MKSGVTERRWLTQLGEDVPEPVEDEHYARKTRREGRVKG